MSFALEARAVPLFDLPMGSRFRVVAVDESQESLLRLMEMGLVPGVEGTLERTAWLKSPYSVRLPGCTLALRREDSQRVMVMPLPTDTNPSAPPAPA